MMAVPRYLDDPAIFVPREETGSGMTKRVRGRGWDFEGVGNEDTPLYWEPTEMTQPVRHADRKVSALCFWIKARQKTFLSWGRESAQIGIRQRDRGSYPHATQ
jgi:hypothetical protein